MGYTIQKVKHIDEYGHTEYLYQLRYKDKYAYAADDGRAIHYLELVYKLYKNARKRDVLEFQRDNPKKLKRTQWKVYGLLYLTHTYLYLRRYPRGRIEPVT